MSTRTKLNISSCTASIMMMLNVFSKPLHIPDIIQWGLLVGMFIPLGLTFYFIKQQKLEKQAQPVSAEAAADPSVDLKRKARKQLILMMVIGSAIGLCGPLWLPFTGATLSFRGDLAAGIITVGIVCAICGYRLKRL